MAGIGVVRVGQDDVAAHVAELAAFRQEMDQADLTAPGGAAPP
ncbi:hypothetical protein [Streptomyces sp. NPDC090798]